MSETQSVCKHCGRTAEDHFTPDYACKPEKYTFFEPVAELASTGEPPDIAVCVFCRTLGCQGQCLAARPSGPSAPTTAYRIEFCRCKNPREGCLNFRGICLLCGRDIDRLNPPAPPASTARTQAEVK